jgi:probable F420-dependent oxidoreductase
MKFGLVTPIVVLNPRRAASWEIEGGPAELHRIAVAADTLGYHHLSCSEHVGIPVEVGKVRGHRYYDPLATFGYMAAVTKRIRFLTHVIVLPYHHPLEVAKRYGTLDRMSGGRLILGVGVGSLKEEFELVGAEFAKRGEIYTEALEALRASLGKRQPVFKGKHFSFDDFIIDPHALQERVPIWLGGRTKLSLKRALKQADGWDPFGFDEAGLAALLAEARTWPEWAARTSPIEIALAPVPLHDLTRSEGLAAMTDQVARYRDIGATTLNVLFDSRNLDHYLEQLEIFATRIAPRFTDV